jgi:hypothetical protein
MEELDIKLNDIFVLLNKKNNKIKNHFDNILKLKPKMEVEYITKLADISNSLNIIDEELKEIYYHLLDNDSTISKTEEELNEIKTYKIDNIIKKTFLPYMMLMKMKLENDM